MLFSKVVFTSGFISERFRGFDYCPANELVLDISSDEKVENLTLSYSLYCKCFIFFYDDKSLARTYNYSIQ